jgi:hypothetical protein
MMKKKKIQSNPLQRLNDHKTRRALCLLAYQPTNSLIELFTTLYNKNEEYDYYVVVDDNEFKIDDLKSQFPKIEWIKIQNKFKTFSDIFRHFKPQISKTLDTLERLLGCKKKKYIYIYITFL